MSFLITNGQESTHLDFNHFSVKVGYSIIQHLEPQIYGENVNTNSASVLNATLSGLETMNGIDIKFHYFFENNIGFYLDLGFGNSENFTDFDNSGAYTSFKTAADFNSQSIGIAAKFSSEKLPVRLILGTSIGRYGYNMSYTPTTGVNTLWYDGSHDILKLGIEALIEFNLFKGINLFSEINYSIQPWVDGDGFELQTKEGEYYDIVYNSPSMAAIRLTVGLGYNF
ncbi:MAG TPA: hypothetical protein DCG75_10735 [Bacteroidales bacterium]|nr:hypothetical protein [Bacteroidales bacterium]